MNAYVCVRARARVYISRVFFAYTHIFCRITLNPHASCSYSKSRLRQQQSDQIGTRRHSTAVYENIYKYTAKLSYRTSIQHTLQN